MKGDVIMFYICGVYNKALCRYFRRVNLTNYQRDLCVRRDQLFCMFEGSSNVLIGVFDSTDSSVEWYSVIDLLSIIDSANVEIKGVKIDYYASYKKRGTARPSNTDSMKSCEIDVALANTSIEFRKDIAKNKLLGVEILEDGTLMNYSPDFCKDGIITLPDEVHYLGRECFNYGNKYPAYMFLVGKNFALSDVWRVSRCLNYGDKNVVVFQDDITIPVRLFTDIKCNIYTRGTIKYGNFKNLMTKLADNNRGRVYGYWNYRDLIYNKRKFFLADSDKICILDFGNFSATIIKNDGQIKY